MKIFGHILFFSLSFSCTDGNRLKSTENFWYHAFEITYEGHSSDALVYKNSKYFEAPPARY